MTICLLRFWPMLFGALWLAGANASAAEGDPAPERKFFIGTSLFVLFNVLPVKDPPSFYQLNVGYRLTPKDVVSLEAITWQYHAPLGIPWGSANGDPANLFPGKVRDVGLGLAYQRFLWKGSYAAVHAVPFHQRYYDERGRRIQTGFQLFMTLRLGYHVPIAKRRVFLEPSVAFTSWPINTNLPSDFRRLEDQWPKFFLFEPGLHAGVNF